MQRRNFPPHQRSDSILLYGFGLTLALSLVFNGFLLFEQNRHRSFYEYELGSSIDRVVWQQQLSDCRRANQEKDSLIHQLELASSLPPGQTITAQHTASK